MLAQRIVYGALAVATIICFFLVDVRLAQDATQEFGWLASLAARGSLVPLGVAILLTLGVHELDLFFRHKGIRPFRLYLLVAVPVVTLVPWLSAAGLLGNSPAQLEGPVNTMTVLMVLLLVAGIGAIVRGNPEGTLTDLAATVLILLYLGFLGSFATQMRCSREIPGEQGAWLLLITLVVVKASDIGAFFAGTAFGRHKLIPAVSPGKTIEGSVGGLVGSIVVALGIMAAGVYADQKVGVLSDAFSGVAAGQGTDVHPVGGGLALIRDGTLAFRMDDLGGGVARVLWVVAFGATMSVFGQLGDLLESCFKRDAHVKDSGRVIPRFGGILDLIDSPILAVPAAWFFLTAVARAV